MKLKETPLPLPEKKKRIMDVAKDLDLDTELLESEAEEGRLRIFSLEDLTDPTGTQLTIRDQWVNVQAHAIRTARSEGYPIALHGDLKLENGNVSHFSGVKERSFERLYVYPSEVAKLTGSNKAIKAQNVVFDKSTFPEDISMRFAGMGDALSITIKGTTKSMHFAELGFKDGKKKNLPNLYWIALKRCARPEGLAENDEDLEVAIRNNLKNHVWQINSRFKRLGLNFNLISFDRKKRHYRPVVPLSDAGPDIYPFPWPS